MSHSLVMISTFPQPTIVFPSLSLKKSASIQVLLWPHYDHDGKRQCSTHSHNTSSSNYAGCSSIALALLISVLYRSAGACGIPMNRHTDEPLIDWKLAKKWCVLRSICITLYSPRFSAPSSVSWLPEVNFFQHELAMTRRCLLALL